MSLIRARSLTVALLPDSVGVVMKKGRRIEALDHVHNATSEGSAWRGAIDALAGWLNARIFGKTQVHAVLSSRFVRYALLPWPSKALSQAEQSVWARLHLEAGYGDMTGWTVTADEEIYGQTRVACAVQQDLLHALPEMLRGKNLSLVSVVPAFACGWNLCRKTLKPGEFFGVVESDRMVLGSMGSHGWESLRAVSTRAAHDELVAVTHREHVLLGRTDTPRTVLLAPGLGAIAGGQREADFIDWAGLDQASVPPALALARLAASV